MKLNTRTTTATIALTSLFYRQFQTRQRLKNLFWASTADQAASKTAEFARKDDTAAFYFLQILDRLLAYSPLSFVAGGRERHLNSFFLSDLVLDFDFD